MDDDTSHAPFSNRHGRGALPMSDRPVAGSSGAGGSSHASASASRAAPARPVADEESEEADEESGEADDDDDDDDPTPAFQAEDDETSGRHDASARRRTPFAFTPSQLHKLLVARSLSALRAFGGLAGLATGLRSDISTGLSVDETTLDGTIVFSDAVAAGRRGKTPRPVSMRLADASRQHTHSCYSTTEETVPRASNVGTNSFADRRRALGENRLPKRDQKKFLRLLWIAFNDKLIILLTISALISLAIGIYQTVAPDEESSGIDWVDGTTIVAAILVIVVASAATDWQKNRKFKKLNERREQRVVVVTRSGRPYRISLYDVVVGDIVHIAAGDIVAVDGVLVEATHLQIDESSISGESSPVHKTPATDTNPFSPILSDPFILSGTNVSSGSGRYLVTAVGRNSTYGHVLMSLGSDVEETPLQVKLGRLGKNLIAIGGVAGAIFFAILFIRFLARLKVDGDTPSHKARAFLNLLVLAITVVIIAIPEGLALNVTFALAFAAKRLLGVNNLVRMLRSCEIMGNATCVCSDKTGTLTQNKMTVVAGRVGLEYHFDDAGLVDMEATTGNVSLASRNWYQTSAQIAASLSPEAKEIIKESIALNSTAFESFEAETPSFVGSSTETALLQFNRQCLGMGPLAEERANNPVLTMLPFNSSRKWMAALIKLPDGRYRLLIKGAAEVIFEYCAFAIGDPTWRLPATRMSEEDRTSCRNTIRDHAHRMLRPVAIAYRDFSEYDVFGTEEEEESAQSINLEWLASGLTLVGLFGLQDPIRPEVFEAVRRCQAAGVFVRMITGDNFLTAKAIAAECGIYTAGGIAMDGPTFRDLTPQQLDLVIPRLQVLARSSPEDKLLLVKHLKKMAETVAVTGDGSNDALALKEADVGFAMGVQGTEVAREAASIILLDDNFASIVKALGWGRMVNQSIKKFCQFQFTINVTAAAITIVSELVGDAIFSVVQLLWINLSMDVLSSLAFATDVPSAEIFQRKPEPRDSPIVSITMWKMILGQTIYQLTVVFVVHYAGWDLFNPDTEFEIVKLQTLVFNIYVWMQFFNQWNCRRVDNKLDIFYQGVLRNYCFLGVQIIIIVGQLVIVLVGGRPFDTAPLTGAQWGWSLLFGVGTIPVGALIRQCPDSVVVSLFGAVQRGCLAVTSPFRKLSGLLRRRSSSTAAATREQELEAADAAATAEGTNNETTQALEPGEETRPSMAASERAQQRLSSITTTTATAPRHIDVQGVVEAAKLGRRYPGVTLELHPLTQKEDPVLQARDASRSERTPPSQDDEFMRFVAVDEGRQARAPRAHVAREMRQVRRGPQTSSRQRRRERRQARSPQVVSPAAQAQRRGDALWVWLLRSKRR